MPKSRSGSLPNAGPVQASEGAGAGSSGDAKGKAFNSLPEPKVADGAPKPESSGVATETSNPAPSPASESLAAPSISLSHPELNGGSQTVKRRMEKCSTAGNTNIGLLATRWRRQHSAVCRSQIGIERLQRPCGQHGVRRAQSDGYDDGNAVMVAELRRTGLGGKSAKNWCWSRHADLTN